MNLQKVLLALVALAIQAPLYGMVAYRHFLTSDNKHILLMGDWHRTSEKSYVKHFISRISYINKVSLKQPIPFIIEFEDEVVLDDTMEIPDAIGFLIELEKEQKDLSDKTFNFERCDPRSEVSRELDLVIRNIASAIVDEVPPTYIEAYYVKNSSYVKPSLIINEMLWKANAPRFKKEARTRPITVRRYMEYLETNEKRILGIVEKWKDTPFEAVFLKKLETYKSAKGVCIEYLKGQKDTDSFPYAIWSLYDKCTHLDERMRLHDKIYPAFVTNTDFLFADVFLLSRVLERVSVAPVVCLYAGFSHFEKISADLIKGLKCKVVHEKNGIEFSYPLLTSFLPDNLENILSTSVIDDFLKPIIVKPGSCWSCSSKKDDLKRCGKCKRAVYCDTTCQNNDWKTHKTICVEAKQPVVLPVKNS